ncbi:fumarylacetoacetate hydrolase family protein [Paenibacillus thalictri]|uniref:FAA hydrolase family protein n=1 Tax=Paenibacillus thalictri TaxID=2527873 RepID=A0A4Q9DIB7_9BACL|nr:fumarylacetoacetate hydrolase family protein [Paenibacillus thalictri]TBL72929.1 FAA hydrolase family protein [Paenibacillus thalictri]
MKLVTYRQENRHRIGALVQSQAVIDLNEAFRQLLLSKGERRADQLAEAVVPSNMLEFLEGGPTSLNAAQEALEFVQSRENTEVQGMMLPLSTVRLETPLANPGKIICVGHNYREHILEMKREIPTHPVLFSKFSSTLIGPHDDIPLNPVSAEIDYEAEFAFIIGKRAKNVSQQDALEHVAGYTIANDISYRDLQRQTTQWFFGKNADGSAAIGPWLVTPDEIADPAALGISLYVNGERRQHSNTGNLVFTVPFLIEYISRVITLEPGDMILTGTPGGVGTAMIPPAYLQDGDLVRIEIEHIGMLENRAVRIND